MKPEYIVSGISGGHGDYFAVHSSFREALQDFIFRGYADYLNTGDVRIRINTGDVVYCTKLCFYTDSVCGHTFPRSIFHEKGD